jgi:hypothetical protein
MTLTFPSGVGHGAMRARLESPRVCYATPGFWIGTTRASRRRQLPTKRCHAARLRPLGATRAYQPDSSSQPLHRQPGAGVLGNLLTRPLLDRQHRRRDRRRRYKPLDGWSFHISRCELLAACAVQRLPRRPLRRVPRRALPSGARRARRRVLHPGRVERGPPAALVVPRELKVETLTCHPDRYGSNPGPGVEPEPERPEGAVIRRSGEPGEPSAAARSRPRWSLMGHWEGRRPRAREAAALCGRPRRGIAGPVAGSPRWRS